MVQSQVHSVGEQIQYCAWPVVDVCLVKTTAGSDGQVSACDNLGGSVPTRCTD